jgi:hypothetical protein
LLCLSLFICLSVSLSLSLSLSESRCSTAIFYCHFSSELSTLWLIGGNLGFQALHSHMAFWYHPSLSITLTTSICQSPTYSSSPWPCLQLPIRISIPHFCLGLHSFIAKYSVTVLLGYLMAH